MPVVESPGATSHRPARLLRHAVAHPQARQAPAPVTAPAAPSVSSTVASRHESHLAEQNNLFSAAMTAEHRGDHTTAVGKLDQLIQRFPDGPLTESARAERKRILSVQPMR